MLAEEGFVFEVAPVEISEKLNKNLSLTSAVQDLARRKAEAWRDVYKHLKSDSILCLTADTMVFLGGQPLGKPKDLDQAKVFLSQLSGKTHSVITGFCLLDLSSETFECGADETLVEFHVLSQSQIQLYVETEQVLDKAGAYGIQGEAQKFVKRLTGSFSNVVGLPKEKLLPLLQARGIRRHS